jgi:uncharacterized protein
LISSVFADSAYWIALISQRDALHDRARKIAEQFGDTLIVTSDMVLVEVLNIFAGQGEHVRRSATGAVTAIRTDSKVCVVPQTRILFEQAHSLYRTRIDKEWSLTDCASFVIVHDRSLTKALTHDTHFEQNGYEALLRNS